MPTIDLTNIKPTDSIFPYDCCCHHRLHILRRGLSNANIQATWPSQYFKFSLWIDSIFDILLVRVVARTWTWKFNTFALPVFFLRAIL